MYEPKSSFFKSRFRIHYVVPHLPDDVTDGSPFQGFLPGVADTHHAFNLIARLPRDVVELVATDRQIATHRLVEGAYLCYPIDMDAFPVLMSWLEASICALVASATLALNNASSST